jgi:hypothetical protein
MLLMDVDGRPASELGAVAAVVADKNPGQSTRAALGVIAGYLGLRRGHVDLPAR